MEDCKHRYLIIYFQSKKFQSIKGCTQNLQDNDGGTWQADPKIAKVVFIEGPNHRQSTVLYSVH